MSINTNKQEDIYLQEFFKTIFVYRSSIALTTLFFIIMGGIYFYMQVPIYSAYSILKVKESPDIKSRKSIFNLFTLGVNNNVKEDITLLKTYYMNNKAINISKVDFKVQYYNNGREIYKNIPIKIDNIEILDKRFLEEKLTLFPEKDGYKLKFNYSFISKQKNKILKRDILRIEQNRLFKYNEVITTKYFKIRVNKLLDFNMPIGIKINGDSRYIYENFIKHNLKISQIEEEVPLIKIIYKDNIQKRAIDYVNSLTNSFIKESIINKNEENNKILDFIREQLDIMKNRLSKSEKNLEKYRISNEVIQPSVQASTIIKELSNIDIEISKNQLKEKLVLNLIKLINRNYSLATIAPSLMELGEKPTIKLVETLQDAQLKRSLLLTELTENHPNVISIERKINVTRRKIRLNIRNLQRYIAQRNRDLKKLKINYEKRLKTLPSKERKLINIKRNDVVSSKMYNFLLEKQTENEMAKVATLSNYKIIDSAYSSDIPISPKFTIIIVAFTLLGLILGIIIAFIRKGIKKTLAFS